MRPQTPTMQPRYEFLNVRTDVRPHMIRADVDDNLWLVDDMANTVTKCDRSGQRLLVLRPKGVVLKEAAEKRRQRFLEDTAERQEAEEPKVTGAKRRRRDDDDDDKSDDDE